jgi:hypothetical protein
MRPYDLTYDFGTTLRAGAVALGLVALAVNAAPAAAPGASTEAGAGLGPISPRGEALAQLAGPPSHAGAAGPGRIGERGDGDLGGILGGHEAWAMESEGVSAAFDSLSRQEQGRVMQRCKDLVARPAQADASQLAICETLMAMTRR